jgi:P27 family predicted phage terminase small subunit
MARGPRPTPTHLKLVRGNPGKRRLNTREPKPRGDLFEAPDWFDDEQREWWTYAIANAPKGLLKRLDREALVVWATAASEHRRAVRKVREIGQVVKTSNGNAVQNPYLPIMNKQAMIMLRAAEQMGFTPAARSRIQLGDDRVDDEDPADTYFSA